jgi:hypothetical protein
MGKDDWAIVIGVKDYPGLTNLQGSEADAKEFFKWVTHPDGGNVPFDKGSPHDPKKSHAILICSSQFSPVSSDAADGVPHEQHIEIIFDKLKEIADVRRGKGKGLRIGRRLYLYFSGHGCCPEENIAALLVANATDTRPHHIAGRPFMDCCQERHRKDFSLRLPAYINRTADLAKLVEGKKFYAFSAKWGLLSKEVPMENGRTRGAFTATLLEGLRGNACVQGTNGEITAASLAAYLSANMKKFLPKEDLEDATIAHEPDVDHDPNGGNFLIVKIPQVHKHKVVVHVPSIAKGKTIEILGADFELVESAPINTNRCRFALERGRYLAEISDMALRKKFEVTGQGIERVEIA